MNAFLPKRRAARLDVSGAIAPLFALMVVPLMFVVGMGVDLTRYELAKASVQHALDAAVLAGGAKFSDMSKAQVAAQYATNYFNNYDFRSDLTVTPTVPTTAAGTTYTGYSSYNLTMSATGSIKTTLLGVLGVRNISFTLTAQAANPVVAPTVTFGPLGSYASDYNSLYMYKIPTDASGNPNYSKIPPASQMYEAGTNCNNSDANYNSNSRCNGSFGSTPPAGNNTAMGTILPTDKIGFMMVNMNNGLMANGNNGYGANAYGAQPGYYEAYLTSPLGLGQPPTQYANNMNGLLNMILPGAYLNQGTTTYPTGSGARNCALQITVVNPNNLPTSPPYPGQCLSPSDPRSGSQYANLSCNEMAGRSFMYWFNDMGGNPDDYNYTDMYFIVKCTAGQGVNGGTISNPAPTTAQYLQLVQ